ncbi:MAG: hypothetical protein ACQEXV_06350 [Bacillota bacterium]|uniref:hypothetical protein n=1 Tax=Paenibacillus maysiensis TaxID=1155954 RepID=UPI000471B3A8|nr:hypothetical protein [Paenibacillus maysiensis]
MLYLYMIVSLIVFYVLVFILSLFNIHIIKGDELIYILLVMIIGILIYIAETLDEKKNEKKKNEPRTIDITDDAS